MGGRGRKKGREKGLKVSKSGGSRKRGESWPRLS